MRRCRSLAAGSATAAGPASRQAAAVAGALECEEEGECVLFMAPILHRTAHRVPGRGFALRPATMLRPPSSWLLCRPAMAWPPDCLLAPCSTVERNASPCKPLRWRPPLCDGARIASIFWTVAGMHQSTKGCGKKAGLTGGQAIGHKKGNPRVPLFCCRPEGLQAVYWYQ